MMYGIMNPVRLCFATGQARIDPIGTDDFRSEHESVGIQYFESLLASGKPTGFGVFFVWGNVYL